jgi:uncharacterized protein (UPF0254 family)
MPRRNQGDFPAVGRGAISLTAGPNITLSQVGNTVTISGGAGGGGGINAAVGGNSTSAGGGYITISAGTMVLAGGANVTLSQNASTITISAANDAAQQTGISSIQGSDATYTSGKVIFTGVGGGITVSSNTGQRIDLSVAAPVAQTVQTQNNVDWSISTTAGGGTAGTMALISSGTVTLFAGNNITISQSGTNTLVISGPNTVAQSVQVVQSAIQASDATYTSGKVIFTGVGGGITVSSNTGQRVDLSVAAPVAQTVQTQNNVDWSVSTTAGGGTAGTMALISSGTVTLFAGNNITISQSGTNTLVISGANQSVQTQNLVDLSLGTAAGGSTSGTMALISSGTLNLFAGDNVTLSQSGTNNITMSVDIGMEALSIGGNSTSAGAGYININEGTAILLGGPNITLSQNGSSVSVSGVASQTVQTQNLFDLSISTTAGGATSGTMALISSGTVTLFAGNNITISQSGTNTLVISGPNIPKLHAWQNMPEMDAGPLTYLTAISKTPFFWPESLPGAATLNNVAFLASVVTTGTLQSFTVHFGVYTYVNSSSGGLLQSVSETFLLSTATSASFSGQRIFVLTSPSTATGISNLTPGAYVFASMISAGASASMNLSLFGATNNTAVGPLGAILPGANAVFAATNNGNLPLMGRGSVTVNVLPAGIAATDLVNQGSGASAPIHPYMQLRS